VPPAAASRADLGLASLAAHHFGEKCEFSDVDEASALRLGTVVDRAVAGRHHVISAKRFKFIDLVWLVIEYTFNEHALLLGIRWHEVLRAVGAINFVDFVCVEHAPVEVSETVSME
jgi:hypothetical protein